MNSSSPTTMSNPRTNDFLHIRYAAPQTTKTKNAKVRNDLCHTNQKIRVSHLKSTSAANRSNPRTNEFACLTQKDISTPRSNISNPRTNEFACLAQKGVKSTHSSPTDISNPRTHEFACPTQKDAKSHRHTHSTRAPFGATHRIHTLHTLYIHKNTAANSPLCATHRYVVYNGEVGGWGRVPFSRNFMSPTPRRKWYLTTGRRAH